MAKVIWAGSLYRRQRGKQVPNWRDRNTGLVVKNKPTIIRRDGRNSAIVSQGSKALAVEPTGKHFFNSDLTRKAGAKVIFKKRTMSDASRKAMFAKMKRR